MAAISNSIRWEPTDIRQCAEDWVTKMRKEKTESPYRSMWWSFVFTWPKEMQSIIDCFIIGAYRFAPLITCRFTDKIVTAWDYRDKLIVNLLHKIIVPVFKQIISGKCYHLAGPSAGIKKAVDVVRQSLENEQYRYFIRADIKDFYASIDRTNLVKQTFQYFNDLRIRKYLKGVITIAIDDGGDVKVPKTGIPRGSSLSPLFGALYLSELDQAFHKNTGISYCRYMDDIMILAKTKRQFLRAKKNLQQILVNLKLKLSRSKTRMGELTKGFHFLGIDFAVARTQQNNKIHVTTSLHPRTYRRALDKINAMEEGAVNPVKVLRYLSQWAAWWLKISDFKTDLYTEHCYNAEKKRFLWKKQILLC
jgi:RNA-directed DNA polymerase